MSEILHPLYAISGISGSGKTTLGKQLVTIFPEMKHIDQDQYYLKKKPQVTLSDGKKAFNWDCLEALDPAFKEIIRKELTKSPVLLTGFALCREVLPVVPKVHIHLVTANNPKDLELRCRESRKKKVFNPNRDALVVRELVIPFYRKIVRNSDITDLLNVYTRYGTRVEIDVLIQDVKLKYQHVNSGAHTMSVQPQYIAQIKEGKKVVEGRKMSRTLNCLGIRRGYLITMIHSSCEDVEVKVTYINYYLPSCGDPLAEYLTHETLERTLPGVTDLNEGRKVYLQYTTEEEIRELGMMAIGLEVI